MFVCQQDFVWLSKLMEMRFLYNRILCVLDLIEHNPLFHCSKLLEVLLHIYFDLYNQLIHS